MIEMSVRISKTFLGSRADPEWRLLFVSLFWAACGCAPTSQSFIELRLCPTTHCFTNIVRFTRCCFLCSLVVSNCYLAGPRVLRDNHVFRRLSWYTLKDEIWDIVDGCSIFILPWKALRIFENECTMLCSYTIRTIEVALYSVSMLWYERWASTKG